MSAEPAPDPLEPTVGDKPPVGDEQAVGDKRPVGQDAAVADKSVGNETAELSSDGVFDVHPNAKRWRALRRRRNGSSGNGHVIEGVARVDRRTKRLVGRVRPGEVAMIDHADLDRVAAETLVEAAPAAVVNAAQSITGRYPNLGPLLLCQAGIPLIDNAGQELMAVLRDGDPVAIDGGDVIVGGEVVASGSRLSLGDVDDALTEARRNMGVALERFAENTASYIREEIDLLAGDLEVPDVGCDIDGRHVLIVVRGVDYKEDLALLQRSRYLKEQRPVLVGVDGGADALREIGVTPDIIIGDFDSVSEETLRCGAELIVHGYVDGRAPGAKRLDDLALPYTVLCAPGTSEDVAMLLAYEKGAELIVAVGTHNSMVEFLDKGRAGMASTLLVRMKVGTRLVDAKGVSRLYRKSVRTIDLVLLVLAAVFTLTVVFIISEPVRLVIRAFWLTLTS
jgi:uncharacterized membrane-anchored protein